MSNCWKPIIHLDGVVISTWKGTAQNGGSIYLAEFINNEDNKRYVLTSPNPIASGNIKVVVEKNASEASYKILNLPDGIFERLDELKKLL